MIIIVLHIFLLTIFWVSSFFLLEQKIRCWLSLTSMDYLCCFNSVSKVSLCYVYLFCSYCLCCYVLKKLVIINVFVLIIDLKVGCWDDHEYEYTNKVLEIVMGLMILYDLELFGEISLTSIEWQLWQEVMWLLAQIMRLTLFCALNYFFFG